MLILLYKGVSPISRIIRWRTWSVYSHAAIVPSDIWRQTRRMADYLTGCPLYEAWYARDARGVFARTGIHVGHTPGTLIDVYEVADPFIDVAPVQQFLDLQLGKAYDLRGVLGFISRRDRAHSRDRWFCSELVFAACLHGGLELLSRIEPHRVYPGLLAVSPHLTHLGSIRTGTLDWEPAPQNAAERAGDRHTTVDPENRQRQFCRPIAEQISAYPSVATISGDGSGRCLPDFAPLNPRKEHFA
jgi:hypothetical protein